MNQFVFERKQKITLISFMVLGALCLAGSYVMDSTMDHTRFWTNLLHNAVFFTGISFLGLFVLAAFTTAFAGWYTVMKRIWEAYAQFLPIGLLLLLPVIAGVWLHWHHLYHWAMDGIADPEHANYDRIIAGKSAFLNKEFYTISTILVLGIWYFFATRIRKISVSEDASGMPTFEHHHRLRATSAVFLAIAGFSSVVLIWQWVMSIDAHWYSTMFAWYSTASWFVACLALTIMMLVYLKSKGYYEEVTEEHLHDLGKFLFAFSVFWTYLWFSQYMLIWYANNGEETIYFRQRYDSYPVLFYGNLVINFVLPFFILMRNSTKRKYGTLIFTSLIVFFGHWWDYFYMIKPGALINVQHASHAGHGHGDGSHGAHGAEGAHSAAGDHAGHGEAGHSGADHAADGAHGAYEAGHDAAGHGADHAAGFVDGFTLPGLLEIGIFLGFTALFIYVVFNHMSKAALVPKNDPYLEESLHHHV
ncbi:MAG: hypothetical protein AAFV25_09565 [Bacteroidota bacterium]